MSKLTDDQYVDAILKETGLTLVELKQGTITRNHLLVICAMHRAYRIIEDPLSICSDENHKWDGSSDCPCMICD